MLDRIKAALAVLRAPSAPEARDLPSLTQPSSTALTTATLDLVRRALEAHEAGQFGESARLAEHALRDADVFGALDQRTLAALGLPFSIQPADESAAAAQLAEAATLAWEQMLPAAALADALRSVVTLGFFVGILRYEHSEVLGHDVPVLEPWAPEFVLYAPWERRWYVLANEGMFPVTPGDGRWVMWAPKSARAAHMYAVIRCIAEWVLRASNGARDASRWSETKGQGIWLAKTPAHNTDTPESRAFVQSVRNMGRSPVVNLPQGETPAQSFDLALAESQSDGWQGFEFLMNSAGRRFRLAILGQDMTSVSGADGGSYAQSKVGDGVRQDVSEFDAKGLGTLAAQVLRPFSLVRTARTDLVPRAVWDASPPEDLGTLATAQKTGAESAQLWSGLGVPVDFEAEARRYGVRLLAKGAGKSHE